MRGTDGADTLVGTDGNDTMYGAGGNDLITGQGGNDVLAGQDGDDTLYGGDGNDYLSGGSGNDVLFGGDGIDWADYSDASGALTINLALNKAQDTHGAGVDFLISIERIYGSAFGDAITGSKYDNLLNGADGADTLSGGGGRDSLIGGAGDDLLDGGAGRDYLEGGAGNDTYVVAGKADVVVEAAGCGVDTVQASVSYHLGDNVENLHLMGTRAIDGWGNSLNNTIVANEAYNHLYGGAGADTFEFDTIAALTGDTIEDYGSGDRIDISAIDADRVANGETAFHIKTDTMPRTSGDIAFHYDSVHDITTAIFVLKGGAQTVLEFNGNHVGDIDFVF